MFYLHGHKNLLPALEKQLEGKSIGDALTVTLRPDQAYGFRRDDAIQRVPIKHLLTKVRKYQPGMLVKVNTRQGPKDVTIVKVGKFNVDVDFNHPYAEKTLTFDIEIKGLRKATPEELSHHHAHGVNGDAHH